MNLFFHREQPFDADQRAYAKALLLGCLIGIGVSWQAVLSDGVRQHIYRGIGDLASAAGRILIPDWTVHADIAQASDTSLKHSPTPHQRLKVPPPIAPAAALSPMPAPAAATVAPLLERLTLVEKVPAGDLPRIEPAKPSLELELTFDINSSFLGPAVIDGLRRQLGRLSNGTRYVIELRATVSDDGVKDADAAEAQRYNRWLAERRLARVSGLLQQHAPVEFAVEQGYLLHDPTRRIIIHARPAP
ncbi:MAG: hypothetical protein ACJ8H8_21275 [Geminicoccaceae bacterium]